MNKKRLKVLILVGTLSLLCTRSVFAVPVTVLKSDDMVIKPFLNHSGSTYLSTNGWSNVVTDNPWNEYTSITVTNHANNPGSIEVKVVSASDNDSIIYGAETIEPGDEFKFPNEQLGKYSVRAKAESNSGTYKIIVKD